MTTGNVALGGIIGRKEPVLKADVSHLSINSWKRPVDHCFRRLCRKVAGFDFRRVNLVSLQASGMEAALKAGDHVPALTDRFVNSNCLRGAPTGGRLRLGRATCAISSANSTVDISGPHQSFPDPHPRPRISSGRRASGKHRTSARCSGLRQRINQQDAIYRGTHGISAQRPRPLAGARDSQMAIGSEAMRHRAMSERLSRPKTFSGTIRR